MNENEYGKIIAKNLKRLAYEKNKTQAEIARDLDISKTTLSSWMSGYRVPRMYSIDMLAKYFGVTRSELTEPHGMVPIQTTTAFEMNIIRAYRAASPERKQSVLLLLGLKEE